MNTVILIALGLFVVFYLAPKALKWINKGQSAPVEGVVVSFSGGTMNKLTVRVAEPVEATYTYSAGDETNPTIEIYDYDGNGTYVFRG